MNQQVFSALCGFDNAAKKLVSIYCNASAPGQELKNWFSSVDFEVLPQDVTCMAAMAAARTDFAAAPEALVPRLRGFVKYVHTLNAGMLSGLYLLGAALNKAEIPVILLNETALYLTYPDTLRRPLWQMRIGVPEEDYVHALDIAWENDFQVEQFQYSASARQNATRQITITPVAKDAALWQDAAELKKGNAVFLCPNTSDLLISICQDAFRALTKNAPRAAIVRWIMDMHVLLEHLSPQQWLCAAQKARQEKVCAHMHLLFLLYAEVTGSFSMDMSPFACGRDADTLLKLLKSFSTCPEKGQRIRRTYLLYRIRRPDSISGTVRLILRHTLRKIAQ